MVLFEHRRDIHGEVIDPNISVSWNHLENINEHEGLQDIAGNNSSKLYCICRPEHLFITWGKNTLWPLQYSFSTGYNAIWQWVYSSSSKEYNNNNIICAISSAVGAWDMLLYWIYCVCSWCMWGSGLPKWINTITSSRWLRHLVPLPVIVLMLYWLPSSREPNLHAVLCIPFTHTRTHTHTHILTSSSTVLTISHP